MAISTPTLVTAGGDTANSATYTTAAVTLVAGRRYILSVAGYRSSAADTVASVVHDAAGTPLSFAEILNPSSSPAIIQGWDQSSRRTLDLWYVDPASTTGSAAITITWTNSQSACEWQLIEIASGFDTGGNGAGGSFPQFATATGTDAAPATTLGSFGDANSLTLVYFGWGLGVSTPSETITETEGRSELDDHVGERDGVGLHYQNPNGSDTTVGGTLSAANNWGILALEVKAAGAGGFSDDLGPASYGITGAALTALLALALAPASYAAAGAALGSAVSIATAPGSHTVSGVALSVAATLFDATPPGSYAVTGAGVAPVLGTAVAPGVYVSSGAGLQAALAESPFAPGAYASTGQTLLADVTTGTAPGAYGLMGLLVDEVVPGGAFSDVLAPGSHTIAGVDLSAELAGALGTGIWVTSGEALAAGAAIALAPGSHALTGTNADDAIAGGGAYSDDLATASYLHAGADAAEATPMYSLPSVDPLDSAMKLYRLWRRGWRDGS